MIARLRTFPLPGRSDFSRWADACGDLAGAALIISGCWLIAWASTIEGAVQ